MPFKLRKSAQKLPVLIGYTVIFYSIWTVWELWAKPAIDSAVADEWLSQLIKSGFVKNLVWTLPALLLAKRFEAEAYVPLKEMFSLKAPWLRYLPLFIAFTFYMPAAALVQKGGLELSFGAGKLITVLFVGLTEESVFRGWLLNVTVREDRRRRYLMINAVMFLVIHFPSWIHSGIFLGSFMDFSFLAVILLGVIFGWVFLESRNLLVPIALHMYWDLLAFMLL